jgi:LAS superfamily LD-carboxypeptidase LdcB
LYYRFYDCCFLTFNELYSFLNPREIAALRFVCQLSPDKEAELTVASPADYYVPKVNRYSKRFVRVESEVWAHFKDLSDAVYLQNKIRLHVISGYRSPAYQAILWLHHVYKEDFSYDDNELPVQLPGSSEHSQERFHAIDISEDTKTFKLSGTTAKLVGTLCSEYGFIVSYPEGNKKGVIYEPWHLLLT